MKEFLDNLIRIARGKPKERAPGPHYGDMLERAVAAGIDLAILYVILRDIFTWLAQSLYGNIDDALFEQARQTLDLREALALYVQSGALFWWLLNASIQLGLIGAYMISTQLLWQATPGKWVLGLKIVRRGTLEEVRPWRYVVRFLGYVLTGIIYTLAAFSLAIVVAPLLHLNIERALLVSLVLLAPFVFGMFNREHRGWHDKMAGTVVLQTRPYTWYKEKIQSAWRKWRGGEAPPSA